jgi:Cys-tRNA synthase (O-phospho-L-seryl-tRNA:Cys-tRNA synthase)
MATLAEQLAEAKAAYHELLTGRAARVVIDQNGERVEFVAANRSALYVYIQSLERQIAETTTVLPPSNAPARFLF